MKMDREEKDILNAYERDELSSVPNLKKETARYREYAADTLKKNKPGPLNR